jgi:hypothetical protein
MNGLTLLCASKLYHETVAFEHAKPRNQRPRSRLRHCSLSPACGVVPYATGACRPPNSDVLRRRRRWCVRRRCGGVAVGVERGGCWSSRTEGVEEDVGRFMAATGGQKSEGEEAPEEAAVNDNAGKQAAVEHATWWMGYALPAMSSKRWGKLVRLPQPAHVTSSCCEQAAKVFSTCISFSQHRVFADSTPSQRSRTAVVSSPKLVPQRYCIPAQRGCRSSTTQPVV